MRRKSEMKVSPIHLRGPCKGMPKMIALNRLFRNYSCGLNRLGLNEKEVPLNAKK
jgi:hypothetical protein